MKRLEKGIALKLSKKHKCTRQYAARIIKEYREGSPVRGVTARNIVASYRRLFETPQSVAE